MSEENCPFPEYHHPVDCCRPRAGGAGVGAGGAGGAAAAAFTLLGPQIQKVICRSRATQRADHFKPLYDCIPAIGAHTQKRGVALHLFPEDPIDTMYCRRHKS